MFDFSIRLNGLRLNDHFWEQAQQRLTNPATLKTIRAAASALGTYGLYSFFANQGILTTFFSFGTIVVAVGAFTGSRIFEEVPFKESLQNWCEEKKGTPEYDFRQQARERIIQCYRNRERSLDLSHLQLSSVPADAISSLTHSLEFLNLSDNQITDPQIMMLGKLKKLDLHHNQIRMPYCLCGLDSLQELDLSENKIASLPKNLYLDNLKSINLSDNQLTCLDPETFDFLYLLKSIDLKNNRFVSRPSGLQRTVSMDLSGNPIPDSAG